MDAQARFAGRLRMALAWKNIKPSDAATELRISRGVLWKWTTGRSMPPSGRLMAIAKLCGVNLEWLMSFEDPFQQSVVERELRAEVKRLAIELDVIKANQLYQASRPIAGGEAVRQVP